MIADVVVDLQYGDCGKGKVTHYLCKENNYTHVIRYNGGCNAGHTIYHNGTKFITHHIPAGIFFGIKSIIGPGCVVDPVKLEEEIKELEKNGINIDGLLFIANNTHIITEEHKLEDFNDEKIGTTKRGNGPAYRDKYDRSGVRAIEYAKKDDFIKSFLIDIYEEIHNTEKEVRILFEGAQGFGLDIDWGDYPYVTSSHCTTAAALLNGVPPQAIRNVWGVAKSYETYVGAKKFQPDDPIFEIIQNVGEELGATTGRKRQVNWMDLDLIKKAANINGVTHLVFNKMDVLDKIGLWTLLDENKNKKISFRDTFEMQAYLTSAFKNQYPNIYFSSSKDKI